MSLLGEVVVGRYLPSSFATSSSTYSSNGKQHDPPTIINSVPKRVRFQTGIWTNPHLSLCSLIQSSLASTDVVLLTQKFGSFVRIVDKKISVCFSMIPRFDICLHYLHSIFSDMCTYRRFVSDLSSQVELKTVDQPTLPSCTEICWLVGTNKMLRIYLCTGKNFNQARQKCAQMLIRITNLCRPT